MKLTLSLLLAIQGISAFPAVLEARAKGQGGCTVSAECDKPYHVSNSQIGLGKTQTTAQKNSAARTNCGQQGACKEFSESQLVSVSGQYAYKAPTKNDIRGPCPGLNAAANHGYLARNGVQTIPRTISGLGKLYSMSVDLAGFLAAYAIIFDGDLLTQTWSIGGPQPANTLGGLLGAPQGISWSHNKYEGDTSIGRCDAYQNGGDAHSLSMQRFRYAYESGMDDDSYTLDKFSQAFAMNTIRSQMTNPYYFAPLFSTTLVAPAAYNFVINFMSNRTAENPSGYLNGAMFKEFFGVGGDYPNFTWKKGLERIPTNWYKRTESNQYNALSVFADLIPEFLAYPPAFRFGGNTNGVNTYTGIDIANFSGGAYNINTLFEGDNFACFFFQNQEQAIPDELKGGVNDVAKAVALISGYMGAISSKLTCPQLGKFDNSVFNQYTGYKYHPQSPGYATNC